MLNTCPICTKGRPLAPSLSHLAHPPVTTIAIVANEPSGDQLGAALIAALQARLPGARFVGVAGPRMLALGCETLLPMERLSVMGLVEVLKVLPELLRARRALVRGLLDRQPAVVIGVDAPDFNLGLERQLRAAGIPAVHLVSPTVWAWRAGRVNTIRRSVDLMLCIFPFETEFLVSHGVPARYIGHPLADQVGPVIDQAAARTALGLSAEAPVIAVLPGSRSGEVERLAEPFITTALTCWRARPALRFIAPMVSPRLAAMFDAVRLRLAPELPLQLLDGHSREAMAAADVLLTASGTATLEGLLHKRPMVVGYRIHPLTYALIRRLNLVKVPYAAMANLLVGRELAPEFLQVRCRADLMAEALLALLDDQGRRETIAAEYAAVHRQLRNDAASAAADAILELIGRAQSNRARPTVTPLIDRSGAVKRGTADRHRIDAPPGITTGVPTCYNRPA